jgi:hypothetical protein
MSSVASYQVRHVDLACENSLQFDQYQHYYFVFWYKSIPLGQFYHSASTLLTESFFWNVCLKSIRPALLHYVSKIDPSYEILQTDHADAKLIRHICKAVIEPFVPQEPGGSFPVSVIICTRDRSDYLKNCLSALQQLAFMPAEVVVVDNASKDDSTRSVASQFKNVRYVREDRPRQNSISLPTQMTTRFPIATGSIMFIKLLTMHQSVL